ncbi:MAG TPA: NFACT RNA binding domain-containing protein [Longimicrobium sp.]|nr:NFACT RNA binding domain-containing protein [Longimicrobium sp.]
MSNVRFDPPLVRALAAELGALLHGRLAHAAPIFDSDLSATLLLDRGQALRWDLHPTRGWVRLVPRPPEMESRPADTRIVRVAAPDDERLLRIDLHEGNRFRGGTRALVLELHTNQWNALLVDAADRRIVSLLRTRAAGGRVLRSGEVYQPPEPQRRFGGDAAAVDAARAEWTARLGRVAPAERRVELLRHFAGTSPINAAAVLGYAAASDDAAALAAAFERWWAMRHRAAPEPVLLETKAGLQPYPHPLDGVSFRPVASLLAGFEAASQAETVDATQRDLTPLLNRARRRLAGVRKRIEALREQEAKVGEGARLRARADLLLAHLARIQPGAMRVTVYDEEGRKLKLPVDPALRPMENVERMYDDAGRRSRAEAKLPELMARATTEETRWASAIAALEAGEVPAWVDAALTRAEAKQQPGGGGTKGPRLPYRVYRTSGGLEVRVGKTSKDNDVLTFRHAAPDDVWMHARQVPGSHVILRWTEDGAPPARDLEEAATLAALHSKARSSGTVAVDWTRRKHVRKPRGAPPGRVMVSHAKTVFVAPDASTEERMREGMESAT